MPLISLNFFCRLHCYCAREIGWLCQKRDTTSDTRRVLGQMFGTQVCITADQSRIDRDRQMPVRMALRIIKQAKIVWRP